MNPKPNLVKREFDVRLQYNVVVSDLTYVRVGNQWNYICVLVHLFNREIIGYSSGKNKDAILVSKAFACVNTKLTNTQYSIRIEAMNLKTNF